MQFNYYETKNFCDSSLYQIFRFFLSTKNSLIWRVICEILILQKIV